MEHPDDNRSVVLLEKIKVEGIVGPADGTSCPREVFIPRMNSGLKSYGTGDNQQRHRNLNGGGQN